MSLTSNQQHALTNNRYHVNLLSNLPTSRLLSRAPLPTIPKNPLTNNLTSTNKGITQTFDLSSQITLKITLNLNSFSTFHPSSHTQNKIQTTSF